MQQLHVILYVISFHYSLRPHQTFALAELTEIGADYRNGVVDWLD